MNTRTNSKRCAIVVVVSIFSTVSSAQGIWTQRLDMPTARTMLSASTVDGKIYAIGGSSNMHGAGLSTVDEYDPSTDTWTAKAPMPTARKWLSTSVVNGKIYAFGGTPYTFQPALSTVEEYDPATDTWTEKAPMPTARFTHSTSVVGGKIYAIGGLLRAMTNGPEPPTPVVEEYDPTTDTWTEKAPMPTARGMLSTSVVDGKIYAIGGTTYRTGLSTVEEYDPATDTWTTKAPMPTPRITFSSSSVVNGIIYVIGGGSVEPAFSTVEAYDPAIDTWTTKTDMPSTRAAPATSVVGGKIYAIGGTHGTFHGAIMATVYEYDTGLIIGSPDFNGDGIVDIKDLLRLIESWGQDNPLCDIAPPPFGDGIVDAMDLELLMSHWKQSVDDPTLIAHWALDETEGEIAYDSAGLNDAFVTGGALWQPDGGQVNGALEFDSVDDSVITGPVLNPASGSLSVFAWIRGGGPEQAVISQQDGANWLSIDPLGGYLMTELTNPGRTAVALLSETVITDGNWHRIGFVWDGLHRTLCVDGIAVAQDTQVGLTNSSEGLLIGCGKYMQPGTYFSGMIDDVRVYNRAVKP